MAIDLSPARTGADSFMEGATGAQNILSNILKGRQNQQQLAQKDQYNKNYFDIQRQIQGRAQKLLPYAIQHYQDIHKKEASEAEIKSIYDALTKDAIHQYHQSTLNNNQPSIQQQPSNSMGNQQPPNMQQLKDYLTNNNSGGMQTPPEEAQQSAESVQNALPNATQLSGNPNQLPGGMQDIYDKQNQQNQSNPQSQEKSDPYSEQVVQPGNPALYGFDSIAGLPNAPSKIKIKPDFKTGLIEKEYPSGKVTVQKMKLPGNINPNLQNELGKQDAKLVGDIQTSVSNAYQSQSTLDEIGKVLTNPIFAQMRQNPIAGKYELLGYQKFGTPEQQNVAGQFMGYTGQVVADMAHNFKGQFRIGEQQLVNSMKVNPGDTVDAAKGKAEALMMMNKMLIERGSTEAKLIRSGTDPIEAARLASKQTNSDLIKKMIREKLKVNEKTPELTSDGMAVLYKNGQQYHIPKNLSEKALSEGGFTIGRD